MLIYNNSIIYDLLIFMSVPESIRKVPRPINTVVVKNSPYPGPHQYAVKERRKAVYRKGKTPSPRNGAVVGHIYNDEFIPIKKLVSAISESSFLSYGPSALIKSLSDDILDDLLKCYEISDAIKIFVMAAIRVINPHVPNSRIGTLYKRHFLSHYYPSISLSKNTISTFCEKLGMDIDKQKEFFLLRLERVKENSLIAIDGTLKSNNSIVNDLSAFSYKGRIRGTLDISVLYAYDLQTLDPICASVFPGNSIDASSYKAFIRDNQITRGIIVADKGFPPSQIKKELEAHPKLHFITPVKRNDKRISELKLTDYQGALEGIGKPVLFCKQKDSNGHFLYSFQDTIIAGSENTNYVSLSAKTQEFDLGSYQEKKERFGLIVIESDKDLDPVVVYRCYQDRWMIEIMFRRYKQAIELSTTRVQNDFSVYGSEFINFISTLITSRIIKKGQSTGVFENLTYEELMDDLSSAWRKISDEEAVKADDDLWIHTNKKVLDLLVELGLAEPSKEELISAPKKRGRPPKKDTDKINHIKRPCGRPRIKPMLVGPKRPRGRPRTK